MSSEESRAYQRAYYLANKPRIIARTGTRTKKWREENKEQAAAYNRTYQIENAARIAERKKKQRAAAKDREQERARLYHLNNAETRNAKSRAWHEANKDSVAARHAKWAKENSHICAERTRRRDALKLKATPAWANREAIQAIDEEAARLTRETGIIHTVDHIVPLQGKTVCGLHHEGNLQILTKPANCAKHNSFPADGIQTYLTGNPR